jgi:hypothetical protein
MNAIDQISERHLVESIATEDNSRAIAGVLVGRLVGLRESGEPFVDFPGNISAVALTARSVVLLVEEHGGREILLTFEEGDPERPIVVGLMESFSTETQRPVNVKVDEDRVVFTAEREIVLRCGKACITLTRAGKVLIRGAYVLSRSSGANRIKGGSVQIN